MELDGALADRIIRKSGESQSIHGSLVDGLRDWLEGKFDFNFGVAYIFERNSELLLHAVPSPNRQWNHLFAPKLLRRLLLISCALVCLNLGCCCWLLGSHTYTSLTDELGYENLAGQKDL